MVHRKMSSRVGGKTELELVPSSFTSKVWKDFGCEVFYDDKDARNVVREIVICRHCFSELQYTGSKTNRSFHVQHRVHWQRV